MRSQDITREDPQILLKRFIRHAQDDIERLQAGFGDPPMKRALPFECRLPFATLSLLLGTTVYGMRVNTPRDFRIGEGLG